MKLREHPGPNSKALARCVHTLSRIKPNDQRFLQGAWELDAMICAALGYEVQPAGRSVRSIRRRIRNPGERAYWNPPSLTGSLDDAARWLLADGCTVIPRRPVALCAMALQRMVDELAGLPACRTCGCTEHAACPPGCSWHEPDLCDACASPPAF